MLCPAPLPVLGQARALVGGHHHLLDPILQGRPLGTHQVVEPQRMAVMAVGVYNVHGNWLQYGLKGWEENEKMTRTINTQPRVKTSEPTQGIPRVPISSPHYFTEQRGQAFQRHIILVVFRLHGRAEIQGQGVDAAICTRKAPEVLQAVVVQRGGDVEMN